MVSAAQARPTSTSGRWEEGFASAVLILLEEGRGKHVEVGASGVGRHLGVQRQSVPNSSSGEELCSILHVEVWSGPLCHVRGKCRAVFTCAGAC
mgnify:CR=1 FL=1